MKITKKDIEKRYSGLTDSELIEIKKSGELTDIALSALQNELRKRGLADYQMQKIKNHDKEEKTSSKINVPPELPKVWIGLIFVIIFIMSELIIVALYDFDSRYRYIFILLGLIGILYWLYCVQKFHEILNFLANEKYPISPGKAIGFHFIPFYNFYWIFKWPIEMSKFINNKGEIKILEGGFIGLFILFCMIIYKLVEGSIGLTGIFLLGLYINSKLKKQISLNN